MALFNRKWLGFTKGHHKIYLCSLGMAGWCRTIALEHHTGFVRQCLAGIRHPAAGICCSNTNEGCVFKLRLSEPRIADSVSIFVFTNSLIFFIRRDVTVYFFSRKDTSAIVRAFLSIICDTNIPNLKITTQRTISTALPKLQTPATPMGPSFYSKK